jgi:hypothetical protein
MPRKNHNAQPIYKPKESWVGLLPYQGRIELRKLGLKITGESIVRQHRAEMMRRNDSEKPRNISDLPIARSPHRPIGIWKSINWTITLEWICWAIIIGCLVYIGIFVITPFGIKIIWE